MDKLSCEIKKCLVLWPDPSFLPKKTCIQHFEREGAVTKIDSLLRWRSQAPTMELNLFLRYSQRAQKAVACDQMDRYCINCACSYLVAAPPRSKRWSATLFVIRAIPTNPFLLHFQFFPASYYSKGSNVQNRKGVKRPCFET